MVTDDEVELDKLKAGLISGNKALRNPYLTTLHLGTEMERKFLEHQLRLRKEKEDTNYLNKLLGVKYGDEWIIEPTPWARLEKRAQDLLYRSQDVDTQKDIDDYDRKLHLDDNLESMLELSKFCMPGHPIKSSFSMFSLLETIRRCFYPDNIEDIKQLLREDGTGFAIQCLSIMEKASPLSLAITLKLLREARKKSFPEVMAMELGVAVNRVPQQ